MSYRFDSTPLIVGAYMWGDRGHGVLAETVPSTGENGPGYLYNDLDLPTDNGKEVRGEIVVWPSSGVFFAYEDSSFTFTGAPDGTYYVDYNFKLDGVLQGTATLTLVVGGTTYEVSAAFTTSTDMGNGGIGNMFSLSDFNTILSSANLASAIGQAQASYTVDSSLVASGQAVLNANALFTASESLVSTTTLANIDVVAAMVSNYAMTASNIATGQASATNTLLSTLQALSISNSFAAISQDSISSFIAAGGVDLDSSCSFSITSSDASVASISIEAIADYSVALGLLCASVANMEASADYNTLVSLVASNNSIINAQALYGIDNSFSVTRTMTTSAGAVVTVTSGFTTSGTQFTSTEVITPDYRMIRVLAENRVVQVLSENRYINVTN